METTLRQQPDVTAEPLEPARSALAGLTIDDTGQPGDAAAPEHEWPASIFIFIANLTAFGFGLLAFAALLSLVFGGGMPRWLAALAVPLLAAACIVQRSLARHVSHFSRWGWYGAMAELLLATLSKVNAIVLEPALIGTVGFGVAIDLVWMRYFWERRADFDIDFDL